MYLVDTDVISEARKGDKGNAGVRAFFQKSAREDTTLHLSVITIGEMRQGVEIIRYRGDKAQADRLEHWLDRITNHYADAILPFDEEAAHVWGRLRVPHPENPLDKQIAATALIYDLTVVTRDTAHYQPTGVRLLNPFSGRIDATESDSPFEFHGSRRYSRQIHSPNISDVSAILTALRPPDPLQATKRVVVQNSITLGSPILRRYSCYERRPSIADSSAILCPTTGPTLTSTPIRLL